MPLTPLIALAAQQVADSPDLGVVTPEMEKLADEAVKLVKEGLRLFHDHPHPHDGQDEDHDHLHEHSGKVDDHDHHKDEVQPVRQYPIPGLVYLNHEEAIELMENGARLIHDHPHDHVDSEDDHAHGHEHSKQVPNHDQHIHQPISAVPTGGLDTLHELIKVNPAPAYHLSRTPGSLSRKPTGGLQRLHELIKVDPVPDHTLSRTPGGLPVTSTSTETIVSTGDVWPEVLPLELDNVATDEYSLFVPSEILLGERSHWKSTDHLEHINGNPTHGAIPWKEVHQGQN
jgi:hypothetical protein